MRWQTTDCGTSRRTGIRCARSLRELTTRFQMTQPGIRSAHHEKRFSIEDQFLLSRTTLKRQTDSRGMKKISPAWFLFFFAPLTAEYVSGSSPYLNPFVLLANLLLYGPG